MPSGTRRSVRFGVRHEHLLGLRALERAERLAVAEHAALVALVEVAAAAEEALAAGRAVAAEHAVALGHLGHAVAGRDDRAHELVPEREAGLDRHAAVVDVQVRAADAGGLDAHDGVVALEQLGLRAAPRRAPRPGPGRSRPASARHAIRGRRAVTRRLLRGRTGSVLVPSELTRGPWDPGAQHAGPPSALLARALERCEPREGMRDRAHHLRDPPAGAARAAEPSSASVVRPGRSVELLEASLSGPDGELMRAERGGCGRAPASSTAPAPTRRRRARTTGAERDFFPTGQEVGYHTAMEYRFVRGGFLEPGPAMVWMRMRGAAAWRARSRRRSSALMVAADAGNGVSAALDWRSYLFINTDLTRPPAAPAGGRVGRPRRGDTRRRRRRAGRHARCGTSAAGSAAAPRRCVRREPRRARLAAAAYPRGAAEAIGGDHGGQRRSRPDHRLLDRHRPGHRRAARRRGHTVYATARRLESIEDSRERAAARWRST